MFHLVTSLNSHSGVAFTRVSFFLLSTFIVCLIQQHLQLQQMLFLSTCAIQICLSFFFATVFFIYLLIF